MNARITTISTAGGWRALCASLLLFFCTSLALATPPDKLVIDGGWRFHLLPGDAREAAHPDLLPWRAATVPGTVHTDLLAHGLIPDPYVGAPEAGLQWIGLADWEYRTAFDVLGGCGVVTAPSTNLQARLEIGAREFDFLPEPAGFLLHVELGGRLVSHLQALRRD